MTDPRHDVDDNRRHQSHVRHQFARDERLLPTGLAFDIPDLYLARAWAEYHELRMVIELDGCTDGEEFEEVLAFYPPNSAFRRWMMWRSATGIVVQPMMGRTQRYETLADALEQVIPSPA